MFKKILIANRGEIANRIIQTCKKLNISSVAVFSEADKDSLHVRNADESFFIGPSVATESYLSLEKIVEVCLKSGAEAIHPGYGFLSENYSFVNQIEREGLTFIGPPSESIRIMGDKIESKIFAEDSGINTIPGSKDIINNFEDAKKIAKEVGFPVMVKASAGGGGKGMRIAKSDADIEDAFNSSINEAKSSFGDDRIFIEKYIEKPRHIEIQILADTYGNVIHLGERECSIQRRNQKIIEESPSSFVDEYLRNEMGEQAKKLSEEVGYTSAGTVEFIVDQNKDFYFLEMNTRLQVEHPVTELVTNLDLVEEMIRIASGEELRIKQEDIQFNGWAIEARIYAEDPERNFMPSTGRLKVYIPPKVPSGDVEGIRNDTGVQEGDEISIYYDPMISKLCTYGVDREEAIVKMQKALNNYVIKGIQNNVNFLSSIIRNKRFVSGDINTSFIDEVYPEGFSSKIDNNQDAFLCSLVAVYLYVKEQSRLIKKLSSNIFYEKSLVTKVGSYIYELRTYDRLENLIIEYEDSVISLESKWCPGDKLIDISIDNDLYSFKVEKIILGYLIEGLGFSDKIYIFTKQAFDLSKHMIKKEKKLDEKIIKCPMPGLVVSVNISEGQKIEMGDKLFTVEAMKMENIIKSDISGKIKKIYCAEGDSLASDQIMIEFE